LCARRSEVAFPTWGAGVLVLVSFRALSASSGKPVGGGEGTREVKVAQSEPWIENFTGRILGG
jgi:hypothetical protein